MELKGLNEELHLNLYILIRFTEITFDLMY